MNKLSIIFLLFVIVFAMTESKKKASMKSLLSKNKEPEKEVGEDGYPKFCDKSWGKERFQCQDCHCCAPENRESQFCKSVEAITDDYCKDLKCPEKN